MTPFSSFDDFTTTNPLESNIWQMRLEEQKLGKIAPKFPVYLYHGILDQIVPFNQAAKLRRDWCDLGVEAVELLRNMHFLSRIGHLMMVKF
jgi:hypothetical protein